MAFLQNKIYHSLFSILNNKRAHWVLIALATISKSILTALYSNYEGDKSFYLLLAKNLGAGEGFTIPVQLLSNPTVTEQVYLPSAVSPLYSILAVPLIKLFPENYLLITWLIESMSWMFLFIVLHRILLQLIPGHFWPNIFVLFSGFYVYNIEHSSSSKDILATALIFFALLKCIRISQSPSPRSFGYLAVTSFIFLLPGLAKYIYLPLAFVFPLSLLFIGWVTKHKVLLRSGLMVLTCSTLFVGLHYLYFHSLETQAGELHRNFYASRWSLAKSGDDFIAGFYPSNILLLYPYIPAAFINLDFIGALIRSVIHSFYKTYGTLLSLLNVAGIVAWATAFFLYAKKQYRKPATPKLFFFFTGTILSFAMLLLALALSLRYKAIEYKGSDTSWTYVFENRPFLFSIFFVQLAFVVFILSKKNVSRLLSRVRVLLFLIWCFGSIHGMFFSVKSSFSQGKEIHKPVSINKLITGLADSIRTENPGYPVWLATEMQHLEWYGKLHQQALFNQVSFLNDPSFTLPPKTILLTAINKEDTVQIREYLSHKKATLLRNYDNTWFVYQQKE